MHVPVLQLQLQLQLLWVLQAAGEHIPDERRLKASARRPAAARRLYAFDVHCNSYFPLFLILYGECGGAALLCRCAAVPLQGAASCFTGAARVFARRHPQHALILTPLPLLPPSPCAQCCSSCCRRCCCGAASCPRRWPTWCTVPRCATTTTSTSWATARCPSWSAPRCDCLAMLCRPSSWGAVQLGRGAPGLPGAGLARCARPPADLPTQLRAVPAAPQVFLWPIGLIFLVMPFSILAGFNPARFTLSIYFG